MSSIARLEGDDCVLEGAFYISPASSQRICAISYTQELGGVQQMSENGYQSYFQTLQHMMKNSGTSLIEKQLLSLHRCVVFKDMRSYNFSLSDQSAPES